MTAQLLASELGNLIQDSKRKNSELRNAAEKSLQDLKSLPVTSEAQLTADLSRRPHFITPFLIACATHNAKFAFTGVGCLQRLSISRALPKERLTEVLEALRDSVSLSQDVQLRILQALPALLQNYPNEIRGEALSITLQICSALQNVKNFAISNTAAATLQQLVIAVFDRVALEDERALEIPTTAEVSIDGEAIAVRPSAHDAYKVFNDLNLLVTGEKPMYIRFSSLPSTSTLELIEAILGNHGAVVSSHPEQIHILRTLLMPMIIRSLSERLSFPITLRIIRILNLLIRGHLSVLPSECEIALGLLNHMLDPEASPLWKRALCLEVFRGIYSDSRLVLQIYNQFDEQEGKKRIFGDNLASFVRLATEKPALIGLGQQSTAPSGHLDGRDHGSDQAVAGADALAGVIGAPATESNPTGPVTGISTQWSSMKTPCMENLDKSEPPTLPETYVYSLVLTCITNVSESLAKFILPLTVHHESKGRKKAKPDERSRADSESTDQPTGQTQLTRTQSYRRKTIPVNPLTLTDHSAHIFIQTSSTLVTECWPAVLATCSTFLNAALDTDFYRALVRAIQKFTQVAGLLRLSTPRDAFLTTLGKAAVPSHLLIANTTSPKSTMSETPSIYSNAKGLLSVDSLVSQSSMSVDKRRPSHDVTTPALGPRNLLCLRALLNLAIALGPTLHSAWSIVFETLQAADLVMALSNPQSGLRTATPVMSRPDAESSEKVEAETAAVQAAARRLFESTVDYPNDSFVELLKPLCALLGAGSPPASGSVTPTNGPRPKIMHQRRLGSVSALSLNTESNARDSMFALNKIGELASLNELRLAQYDPDESGWNHFVTSLVRFSVTKSKPSSTRLLAADIVARSVKEIADISMSEENRNDIQGRILSALKDIIASLHGLEGNDHAYDDTDVKIHHIVLEALKNVIEQCGESLVAGWESVFDSLASVFSDGSDPLVGKDGTVAASNDDNQAVQVISKMLARSAFGTVQLVCSDFLSAVPDTSFATLLELLLKFSRQQDDLNMSLTTITFFWNVSDFFHSRTSLSRLPELINKAQNPDDIRREIHEQSRAGCISVLWLQVLTYLSAVTTDKRSELRNSAVQTIQRIFENCGDQLSSDAWMLCLRTVLFGMVEANLAVHKNIHSESQIESEDVAAWNETTKTVLSSASVLIATYVENVGNAPGLAAVWSDLLDYLQKYFDYGSHALGSSVFTSITSVLTKTGDPNLLGASSLHKTAKVWDAYFDHRDLWTFRREPNQEAFVAYTEAFRAIYKLSKTSLDPRIPSMLGNLEIAIMDSDEAAYSSDLDHLTPLQARVIDCLTDIDTDGEDLSRFFIELLGRFTILPYESIAREPAKRGPTFVAFSKASMKLLESITVKHISQETIYTSGAYYFALRSLAKPIQEKYVWAREGKSPTMWQTATSTSLAILKKGLPYVQKIQGEVGKDIWSAIVSIASGIIGARLSTDSPVGSVAKDELFDISSFNELRDLVTKSLGTSVVSDGIRRTYTRHLFETSVIHAPAPGELPNLASSPLEDLYQIRYGSTSDPDPVLRDNMAYLCLSELFSLVSVRDSSTECIKLAQAAAPFLILRAALTLKAYIADHPLRGRMPQPESQRKELLFVLKKLATLDCEPQSIPDAPGATSKHKKHLHRLYPLLVKASSVARNDGEVFRALTNLTEIVGVEFGVDDD
ncbi:hypothetical protein BU24DRAFT_489136 [Aaosphaeria arxii CBS 175.79]|uniref:Endosomal peripheral membrane protein-like protein n=1 Tax=Aaosphaeria arxii CBS 175.79 TaxID=1450172 RepID=A0A6A5Y1I6_9PLEO|nr:uncharacterized protein BU24DRAFT_489136 [Aaosphaeria arxii CBS 175.79]KAF2019106.1 hypothetical protein BU24DRAFT_489136 [Aaosphaeria arxii CBS 175.79]